MLAYRRNWTGFAPSPQGALPKMNWKDHDNTAEVNNARCCCCCVGALTSGRTYSAYSVAQKIGTVFFHALPLSNVNRFSTLFHCQNQEKIFNNTVTKDPTTPQMCWYTTFMLLSAANCHSVSLITSVVSDVVQQQCGHTKHCKKITGCDSYFRQYLRH